MSTELTLEDLKAAYAANKEQFQSDFFDYLRFDSISTDGAHTKELADCCAWIEARLDKLGFSCEKWPCDLYPTLFAEYKADPNAKTILIYGHYDVQPVDPIGEWESEPFEPTVRDGKVYARGASDNKGQLMSTLIALDVLFKNGPPNVNIKILVEGEEEIGSGGISRVAFDHTEELKADYLLIPDTDILAEDKPSVTLSLRGIVTCELIIREGDSDRHSGMFGGLSLNPIHALVSVLDSMRDMESGSVIIDGFYDEVNEPSVELLARLEPPTGVIQKLEESSGGVFGGEKSRSPIERLALRPTCEINGIIGGYTGDGFKTVIGKEARAKISCRLVDPQTPEHTKKCLEAHIKKHLPQGVDYEIEWGHTALPVSSKHDSEIVEIVSDAYGEVFGVPCKMTMSGGTVGVTKPLQQACGAELVIMGFGTSDDAIHAPNESFGLKRLEKGFLTMARILQRVSRG